jgi:hypothetical protein
MRIARSIAMAAWPFVRL